MKGMRQRFQNKRGKPRQRPMGRIIRLAGGTLNNTVWRIK